MYTPSSFTHSKRLMSSNVKGRISRLTPERLKTISFVFQLQFICFRPFNDMFKFISELYVTMLWNKQRMSSAYLQKALVFQELSNQPHIKENEFGLKD